MISEWLFPYLAAQYPQYLELVPQGIIILDTIMEYNNTDNSQLVPGNTQLVRVTVHLFILAYPICYKLLQQRQSDIYGHNCKSNCATLGLTNNWNRCFLLSYDFNVYIARSDPRPDQVYHI